jgi:hypothetical protein
LRRPGLWWPSLSAAAPAADSDFERPEVRLAGVGGEHFADGRSTQNFALPALGEATVPVSVDVPTKDFLERVMRLGAEGRFDYRLTGEAELDHWFLSRLPFEREGSLAVPEIPGRGAVS